MTKDVTIIQVPEVCQASVFFVQHVAECCGYVAFDCAVRLEVFLRLLGRVRRSKAGRLQPVSLQRVAVPLPLPSPMPDCTLRDRQHLLVLRHDLRASVGLPLVPHRTERGPWGGY